jgi:hypothetical protein
MDVWLPDLKFGPGRCAMTLAKTRVRRPDLGLDIG